LPDKHSPSPVVSLASEKPATLIAQLRAVWPDVERALNVGHTLRVIHRRLNQMGVPITYRRLTVYRGRLQREKEKSGQSRAKAQSLIPPVATGKDDGSSPGSKAFDPLSNFREQEKKPVVWQYPSGPPDESKLI
jgi:hypothetical protein